MRTRFAGLSALLLGISLGLGLGCDGEGPTAPPLTDGGGGVDRFLRETAGEDAGANAEGGAMHDGGTGDGTNADRLSDALRSMIQVTIRSPAPGVVVRVVDELEPMVEVAITTPAGAPAAVIKEVVAELLTVAVPEARISSTSLGFVSKVTGAAISTSVYGDTPLRLTGLVHGEYKLRVTATVLSGASSGEAEAKFFVDPGPVVRILKPEDNKHYKGQALVEVFVDDPLFLPIKTVVMSVGSRVLTVTPPAGGGAMGAGLHVTTIDFNSYVPPLEDVQLFKVTATNKNDTRTSATVNFNIDNKGPVIAGAKPDVGSLIGQVIRVQAEVTDPAGVDPASVVAVVAHGAANFEVKLKPPPMGSMAPIFSEDFDTRLLPINAIFPTISFRAKDILGNESSVGYALSLDNTPPVVDLDPPADFRAYKKAETGLVCSWPFDPVGPDAVDDGDVVPQLFDIRARIEDNGNSPVSGPADFIPISGINPSRVQLLILDDTSQSLVVDTNGNGDCDSVNPNLVPTTVPMSSRDALLVNMVSIAPGGPGDFTPEPGMACTGAEAKVPDPTCDTTDNVYKGVWGEGAGYHSYYMSLVIPYANARLPAIWTLPPVVGDGLQCAGRQFDSFANNINDGWVCLAVAVADNLGNSQVSRPLRVCIDHDGMGNECPHLDATVFGTTPVRVTTTSPHGLANNDEVIISRSGVQTGANGRWTVNVVDANTFTLPGAVPVDPNAFPMSSGSAKFVPVKALPNCTGTRTSLGPPPVINNAAPCRPWLSFPAGDSIRI